VAKWFTFLRRLSNGCLSTTIKASSSLPQFLLGAGGMTAVAATLVTLLALARHGLLQTLVMV
jgi:hypothetical protein